MLNNNKIRAIPNDIGQLENLEELILSENYIEDFPVSVSMMASLKVIKLSNNRLKSIPFEVADILTLEEIDCSNNPNLDSIPAKWRGDTDSVLFTCKVHRGTHLFVKGHIISIIRIMRAFCHICRTNRSIVNIYFLSFFPPSKCRLWSAYGRNDAIECGVISTRTGYGARQFSHEGM